MAIDADFEQFASAVSPMLYRTAWSLVGNKAEAEDLVQETLSRLLTRAPGDLSNPAGYARTTLTHLYLRSRSRRWRLLEGDAHSDRRDGPDVDSALDVRDALDRLQAKDRAVIVLRYVADLTVQQVAAELGLTEQAVRSRSVRALARLRNRLTSSSEEQTTS